MPSAVNIDWWKFNFSPKTISPRQLKEGAIEFQNDTLLIVSGSFSPFHLSHMIMNNLLPIQEIITHHQSEFPRHRHLLTLGRFPNKEETIYSYPTEYMGFERKFSAGYFHSTTNFTPQDPLQIMGGDDLSPNPLQGRIYCYPKAVIGLSQSCADCPQKPSIEAYEALRLEVLLHFGLSPNPIQGKVLLIQREKGRSILNIAEIEELLKRLQVSYNMIMLTGMDFKEQVRHFSEASVTIAPHGNGNAHIHWMKRGTAFLEAFNPHQFGRKFYGLAAVQMGLKYIPLDCEDPRCWDIKRKEDPRNANMIVNVRKLEVHLEKLLKINRRDF